MASTWRDLAVSGHSGNLDAAHGALADLDPVARQLALGALARLDALTEHDVRQAMADTNPAVRRRAVELSVPFADIDLFDALHDADNTVTEVAAWACGERASVPAATLHRLVALATDANDPLVREAAVAALGAVGEHLTGAEADAAAVAVLRSTTDKPAIRRRSMLALAAFTHPGVEQALRDGARDRDWQVRQAAEDMLRATGYSS